MDSCPKCKSRDFRKDGIVKSRQRYFCKECKHHFTVEQVGKPSKLKRDALVLYLEGLGFRSIGRCLNISHVAVLTGQNPLEKSWMSLGIPKILKLLN